MNIQGIYNCAHPRLNNKKNMTTVTKEACESDSNDKVNSWRGEERLPMRDGQRDVRKWKNRATPSQWMLES